MKKIDLRTIWLPIFAAILSLSQLQSQSLPFQMRFSDDGRRLVTGARASEGMYDENIIRKFEFVFDQSNYWALLTNNYNSKTDLPATLYVDGEKFEQVGIRFKGQTSYSRANNTQKKSFNISMDYADPDQEVMGYETMNLNNSYEDPTFLREVLYLHFNRRHIPAAQANYVHLYINGQDWGVYPSVQQLNGDFLEQWFLSNDGTRWRAERTAGVGGPGGPGGNPFGAGTSSLNYLGADTSLYTPNYTLKTAKKANPWDDLVHACDVLNNPPLAQLEDTLKKVFDTDRALWFIAHEIIFGDDDSYVNKGGMDYYVYWDKETDRVVPLEYDGNSVMGNMTSTWIPFLKENDTKFPLMNRLFKVPELRQRYLAHVRTIIEEDLDAAYYGPLIDFYHNMIDSLVQTDPKKIYTYNEFVNGKNTLKNYLANRRNYLLTNAEVKRVGPTIENVVHVVNGEELAAPKESESVNVSARATATQGVLKMNLYFGKGLDGYFEKTEMYDDGAHADGAAADGIFGGTIPAFEKGTYVRYYVEAVANDGVGTVSYMPKGAEHDVYIYQVQLGVSANTDIVINELMASNETTITDQDGDYDDWIELYNKSTDAIDISGWFITDNPDNLDKFEIPAGTVVPANGYLIIWADEDDDQEGLHANFKLSASGEVLILLDPSGNVVDRVDFGAQETDMGYARIPNGTGDFVIQASTFNRSNDLSSGTDDLAAENDILVFPNPASRAVTIATNRDEALNCNIFNSIGQLMAQKEIFRSEEFDLSGWPAGVYVIQIGRTVKKLLIK